VVFSNVVINNVTAATTSASERYVRHAPIWLFIMFCEYMFSCYVFPLILLFSTSSMFELHVVVAAIVMYNILELIMELCLIIQQSKNLIVGNFLNYKWLVLPMH
jgi:hypothetical protein